MHMEIYLDVDAGGLKLPIHYNHMIQGAIYNSIDQDLAFFLHNQGYIVENRHFKLFTFSRLNGNYKIQKEENLIVFFGDVKLIISSPVEEFCHSLVNTLLSRGYIFIGKQKIGIKSVFLKRNKVIEEELIIRALSPVVLYSTLLRPDGSKYTCYFYPEEPDYNRLITENLRKKYQAIHKTEAPLGEIKAKAIGRKNWAIVKYKNFIIKGYVGKLILSGPKELLQVGVDSGLGSKNSQGFGCVEVI